MHVRANIDTYGETPQEFNRWVGAWRAAGASKGTPDDAKCVTEIPGDKNKEVRGGQHLTFYFKGKLTQ